MKNLETITKCEQVYNPEDMASGVDSFSSNNAEIMKQIQEEQAAKELEAKKNAAKLQLQKDSFEQEFSAITYRKDNNTVKAKNEALKLRTAENEAYLAGNINTETHQHNIEKIDKDLRDKINKIEDEFSTAYNKLCTKNPEGYRYSRTGSYRW